MQTKHSLICLIIAIQAIALSQQATRKDTVEKLKLSIDTIQCPGGKISALTVIKEAGYGAGFGAVSALGFTLAAKVIAPREKEIMGSLDWFVVSAYTGYTIGSGYGVYFAAEKEGWRPNLPCTLTAACIGSGLGVWLYDIISRKGKQKSNFLANAFLFTCPLLCSGMYVHLLDEVIFPKAKVNTDGLKMYPSLSISDTGAMFHIIAVF